jgi:integrase
VWYVTLDGVQHNLGPDEQSAQQRYFELLAKRPASSRQRTASSQTVAALVDDFLDWCQKHRAPRSFLWYQTRLQSFLLAIPKDLLVTELKPFHLTRWIDGHPAWNDTTRRGSLVAVLRTCNWGVRQGHLETSPLKHVELPQAHHRERVISQEEYDAMRKLATDRQFEDILTVAWECGPRPQELIRVEARHVDLERARWVFPVKESKGKRRERVV